MNLQSVLTPFRLFFNRFHHYIFFFSILGFVAIFNLWAYPSRILLLIFLYVAGSYLVKKDFVLLKSQGENVQAQSIWESIRFFIARSYPFLFLFFILVTWKFKLWHYLDRFFGLLVLYILGCFALQLLVGPVRMKDGYKKIHTRAKEGDSTWVKSYLERGGDPNVKSSAGVSPLYLAAEAGHLDTVRILVEGGADVNQKADNVYWLDCTPVLAAAYKGHDDIVEFLLENGANRDIYLSAISGDLEALGRYVEAGGDIAVRPSPGTDRPYLSGQTLLHLATWKDSVAAVDFLLENGAEIEIRDGKGHTPLHSAAAWNGKNVAQLLIERGANINAQSESAQTPLHCAARSGNLEIAQLLLDWGANINAWANCNQDTALHFAIEGNHLDMVRLLVERGADVNAKMPFSQTPLQRAKTLRRKEIVNFLKECGAK